eukprot:332277_1
MSKNKRDLLIVSTEPPNKKSKISEPQPQNDDIIHSILAHKLRYNFNAELSSIKYIFYIEYNNKHYFYRVWNSVGQKNNYLFLHKLKNIETLNDAKKYISLLEYNEGNKVLTEYHSTLD